jgi:NADH-quinone oxidoreductase subunit N
MFRAIIEAGSFWAIVLAVVAAVNAVIAFFYYSGVIRQMWFREPIGDDQRRVAVPPALGAAIALTTVTVVAVGVYPELFARVGDLATRFVS